MSIDKWKLSGKKRDIEKLECEVCGSYTVDPEAIKETKNNICPVCFSFGSLFISKKNE